jgi:hypothetical protein
MFPPTTQQTAQLQSLSSNEGQFAQATDSLGPVIDSEERVTETPPATETQDNRGAESESGLTKEGDKGEENGRCEGANEEEMLDNENEDDNGEDRGEDKGGDDTRKDDKRGDNKGGDNKGGDDKGGDDNGGDAQGDDRGGDDHGGDTGGYDKDDNEECRGGDKKGDGDGSREKDQEKDGNTTSVAGEPHEPAGDVDNFTMESVTEDTGDTTGNTQTVSDRASKAREAALVKRQRKQQQAEALRNRLMAQKNLNAPVISDDLLSFLHDGPSENQTS